MNRWLSGVLAVLVLWAMPALAHGQSRIGSYQRPQVNPHPTVSPYLNLGRGGNGVGTAIDYYGIVRPQQDLRNNVVNLQQQIQGLQQTQPVLPVAESDANLPITGRGIGGFMNYGHYFPLLTQGTAGNRPVPTGSAGTR
jgi:hypothetical protein